MASLTFTRHIKADPRRVFEVLSDFRTADQRVSGIKKLEVLTDGPIRKGTRFRETRVMFGREATEEMEVADFQPDRSYTVSCNSCGAVWSSTFRFVPEAGGTRLEVSMECRAVSFLAKLMKPLSGLFAGSIRKCVQQDLEDMARFLESKP